MWEVQIESLECVPIGIVPINQKYYELPKAVQALQMHTITNATDKRLVLKTEQELAELSLNQLKLWNANIQILNQINATEVIMGRSEPTTNLTNVSNTPAGIITS